jgi:hypothetical protein
MSDINYTWEILQLECASSENKLTNVIKKIDWSLKAQEQKENGFYAVRYGAVGLGTADPDSFTDYSSLTQQTVQTWLENALKSNFPVGIDTNKSYIDRLKEDLLNEIEFQRNPPVVYLNVPWNNVGSGSTIIS